MIQFSNTRFADFCIAVVVIVIAYFIWDYNTRKDILRDGQAVSVTIGDKVLPCTMKNVSKAQVECKDNNNP